MYQNLPKALKGVDAVIFAVRHECYMDLTPDNIVEMTGGNVAVVDCFGILDDGAISQYFKLECEVKGLGRGHVQNIRETIRRLQC